MNQNKEASKHVVIIGTGAGGVALAARLAHAGFRVSVYEKNDYSGGRLSLIEKDGFRFDQGPSLYLMPKIFQETFNDLGVSMEKHYKLVRCDPNYRLYFEDGKTLDLCSDLNTMKDRLHEWDPQNSFDDFQKASRVHYEASVGYVLTKLFQKWFDFFNVNNLKLVPKLNLHQSLYSFAAKHFQNPQLRQAFTFQSMYMGMSPFDAPATYSLLQYTEFAEGIWYPIGGFHRVVSSLQSIAESHGAKFHFGTPVTEITVKNDKATGVRLPTGWVSADIVVSNADLVWTYQHLLPKSGYSQRLTQKDHTSSSFSFYWGLNTRMPQACAHNVFLANDYQTSFDTIFRDHGVPEDLSFYIHVPSKLDPHAAPNGKEAVTVLVPCGLAASTPGLDKIAQQVKKKVVKILEKRWNVSNFLSLIETEIINTPATWAEKFNLFNGSILGLSHSIFQVCYFRPSTQHAQYPNVYFVGASTHPGTGVPICLYGAKLVSQQIQDDLKAPKSLSAFSFMKGGSFGPSELILCICLTAFVFFLLSWHLQPIQ